MLPVLLALPIGSEELTMPAELLATAATSRRLGWSVRIELDPPPR